MNRKWFLSACIAAFLVVGSVAHGATHDFTPDTEQEFVECQACHLPFSETEQTEFAYTYAEQTTRFELLPLEELPREVRQYRSRAPPKQ